MALTPPPVVITLPSAGTSSLLGVASMCSDPDEKPFDKDGMQTNSGNQGPPPPPPTKEPPKPGDDDDGG